MEAEESRTAMLAATARGLHRYQVAQPWVFDDPFALPLVGPDWLAIQEFAASLAPELADRIASGIVVRARYAEDRLALCDADQYVLIGAGLDSFGWRRPDQLEHTSLFEVDHPASQEWKRRQLDRLALPTHQSHRFVPVDFERQSLWERLVEEDFNPVSRTFFSWIAVIPYLTRDAIEATMQDIARCSTGSEVIVTYAPPDGEIGDDGRAFHAFFGPLAASSGEEIRTRLSAKDIVRLVEACGFRVTDHPSADELALRYTAHRQDIADPYTVERAMCVVRA